MNTARIPLRVAAATAFAWLGLMASTPALADIPMNAIASSGSWSPGMSVVSTDGSAVVAVEAVPGSSAMALASLDLLQVRISDSTHWTLGPWARATYEMPFSVLGDTPTRELVFTAVAQGSFDTTTDHDFNTQADFGLAVTTYGASYQQSFVYGAFTMVNCLGCGGLLGGGSVNVDGTVVAPWNGNDLDAAYALSGLSFETQTAGAGRIYFTASSASGGGTTWLDLQLVVMDAVTGEQLALSMTDQGLVIGAAPVPEPAPLALLSAGLVVLAWRRHTARSVAAGRA